METHCIYHGNCADGFTGAWVVRKALGEGVIFHAGVHQTPPPSITGATLVMVDFSYKRNLIVDLAKNNERVIIIDHHKTAEEDLLSLNLSNVEAIFDMNKCGCVLAWEKYFPEKTMPQIMENIQDRDLWKFVLPGTREIQASIFSYEYEFDIWDKLMSTDVYSLREGGVAIERKHHKDVAELVAVLTRWMKIGGHVIPVANLPYTLSSDSGELLCKMHGTPFAGCYYDSPRGRIFSLRSLPGGADVGAIAKIYGGGGHQGSAGFTVPFDVAKTFEL